MDFAGILRAAGRDGAEGVSGIGNGCPEMDASVVLAVALVRDDCLGRIGVEKADFSTALFTARL
jgi:hypothetical protein